MSVRCSLSSGRGGAGCDTGGAVLRKQRPARRQPAQRCGYGLSFRLFGRGRAVLPGGQHGESAISVVKTQNVYYGKVGDWAGYYDTITSDIAVGCWHVQLPTAYGTFEAAQEAAVSVSGGFPAWIEGTYYVRVGAYLTSGEANAAAAALGAAGAEAVGTSSSGVSVVRTGTSRVLFQFDGGAGVSLVVRPGLEDGVKTVTHFRGYRYYGDFQYQRRSGGNLTVVNFVPMEDYVNCVISREMSNSWPLEALKAQAVCARTYAAMNRNKHSSKASMSAGVPTVRSILVRPGRERTPPGGGGDGGKARLVRRPHGPDLLLFLRRRRHRERGQRLAVGCGHALSEGSRGPLRGRCGQPNRKIHLHCHVYQTGTEGAASLQKLHVCRRGGFSGSPRRRPPAMCLP